MRGTCPEYNVKTSYRTSQPPFEKEFWTKDETCPGTSRRYIFVLFFLVLMFIPNLKAQSLDIAELSLDTNYLKLGQQTILKFSVTCNKDRRPVIPDWKEVLKDKLDIISQGNADTIALTDAQIKISQELVVAKFNEDTSVVDSLFIPLVKKRDTIFIPCDDLRIYPIPEKVDMSKDFRDIKSPEDVPFTLEEILPYALVIIGLIVFAVIIYFVVSLIRKRRKKKTVAIIPEEPKIIIPADVIALEKLNKLKADEKWFTTDSKAYLTELTNILREYIFNRWGFDAQESTSEEILGADFIITIDHLHLQNLKDILSTADFVKFAKANTSTEENKTMLNKAFIFVETTALPPENSDNVNG